VPFAMTSQKVQRCVSKARVTRGTKRACLRVCLLGPEGNGRLVRVGMGGGAISWGRARGSSLAQLQPRAFDDNVGIFKAFEGRR